MAASYHESCLHDNFISAQSVRLDDIVRRASPSRSTRRTGVLAVMDSIINNGFDPTSFVHLYNLSDAERASTGKLYGIINGSSRLQAQIELKIMRPDLNLPSHVNAKLYRKFSPQVLILVSGMLNEVPSILPTKNPSILDSIYLLCELLRAEERQLCHPVVLQPIVQKYLSLGFTIAHSKLLVTDGFFDWALGTTSATFNFLVTIPLSDNPFDSIFNEEFARAFYDATFEKSQRIRGALLNRIWREGESISGLGPPERIMNVLLASISRAETRVRAFLRKVQEIENLAVPPSRYDLTEDEQTACNNLFFNGIGVMQDFQNLLEIRYAAQVNLE